MEKKEAMKILKEFHDKSALFSVRTALDTIFPELRVSEDERMRKRIIQAIKIREKEMNEDWSDEIAWLEKQNKEPNWKPSKEQDKALDYAFNSLPDTELGNYYEGVLLTLIEDLHRLEKQGENKPIIEMKLPEKVYIDDFGSGFSHGWHTEHSYEKDIEYVHKDTFIDKACEWFEKNASNYIIERPFSLAVNFEEKKMIEDFKKYMKGE